ncbi:MAG: flagellar motor switch protein FliM [Deltaproteobacteria bacterium]|nr:flagellar motor switch protein FliM [Candidatus Anaeroferrophillus wilburensis]MBN2889584.1 flagellar motor switch protein FliM [Deltaproteobacteria bacterium]
MSQVLTQQEIDALLQGVSDGDIETEAGFEPVAEEDVSRYDLTSQERIIRGKMPTLEIINQRFSRNFRAALSGLLHRVIDVTPLVTDMMKFGEFLKTIPVPASIHLFKMDPLRGLALMVVESKLVFSLIDMFFGGSGRDTVKVEGRDFTSIEERVIKKVVEAALHCMEEAWNPIHDLQFSFVRSEINPQFVSIVPPSDVVILSTYTLEMEEFSGAITVCLPYSLVEPMRNKLYAGFQSERLEVDVTWLERLISRLMEVDVELSATLGTTSVTPRQLLGLEVGDIITLQQDSTELPLLKIEQLKKFRGVAGFSKGSKAVKISRKITGIEGGK